MERVAVMQREGQAVSRPAEIADYLLSTGIGDTEAAWAAEVKEAIAARWPDVTEVELHAAFLIAMVDTAIQTLDAAEATAHAAATPAQA